MNPPNPLNLSDLEIVQQLPQTRNELKNERKRDKGLSKKLSKREFAKLQKVPNDHKSGKSKTTKPFVSGFEHSMRSVHFDKEVFLVDLKQHLFRVIAENKTKITQADVLKEIKSMTMTGPGLEKVLEESVVAEESFKKDDPSTILILELLNEIKQLVARPVEPFVEQMFSVPSVPIKADIGSDSKEFLDNLFDKVVDKAEGISINNQTYFNEFFDKATGVGGDFMNKLESIAEKFRDVNLSFDFSKTFNSLANSRIAGFTKEKIEQIAEFLNTPLGEFLRTFFIYIGVVYVLRKYCGFENGLSERIVATVVTLLIPHLLTRENAAYTGDAFKAAVGYVNKLLFPEVVEEESEDSFVDQGNFDTTKTVATKGILSVLLGFITKGVLTEANNPIEAFMKSTHQFDKFRKSTENTVDFLLELVASFLRFVGDKLDYNTLKGIGLKFPEIEKIATELCDITLQIKTSPMRLDTHLNTKLMAMQRRLQTIAHSEIPKDRKFEDYRREAYMLIEEIRRLTDITSKGTGSKGGPRVEPVTNLLIGKPGIGKSLVSEMMIYDVTPQCMDEYRLDMFEKNKNDEVFTITANMDDHWDGYTGQFAVRVDDILQSRDAAGMPNPTLMSMITMVNTAPFFMNFAAMALKGSYEFVSELIFATDNNLKCGENVIKSLNCPSAFARRFDFVWLVTPKPEHASKSDSKNGEDKRHWSINKSSLMTAINSDNSEDLTNLHDYWEYDWSTGKITGGPYTYQAVVDAIVEKHGTKKKFGGNFISNVNTRSERAIALKRARIIAERAKTAEPASFKPQMDEEKEVFSKPPEVVSEAMQGPNAKLIAMSMRGVWFNPYKFFNLPTKASRAQIREAWLNSVRAWHPDKEQDPFLKIQRENHVVLANWAYTRLSTDVTRKETDIIYVDTDVSKEATRVAGMELMKMMQNPDWKATVPEDCKTGGLASVWRVINQHGHSSYEHNCQPSQTFLKVFCERTGLNAAAARAFFIIYRWDEDTPMGDWVRASRLWYSKVFHDVSSSVLDTIETIKQSICDVFTNKTTWIVAISALSLGAFAWKLWRNNMEEQTERPARKVTKTRINKKIVGARKISKNELIPLEEQTFTCSQALIDMGKAIQHNLYWFSYTKETSSLGWILFYRSRISVNVGHMFSKLQENGVKSIWLHNAQGDFDQEIFLDDVIPYTLQVEGALNEDETYSCWKSLKRETRDITAHFASELSQEGEILKQPHYGALLMPSFCNIEGKFKVKNWNYIPGWGNPTKSTYGAAAWEANNAICYNISTSGGDCGLPWIVTDRRVLRPCIGGVHIAGNGVKGLAMVVNKETCQQMAEHLKSMVPQMADSPMPPGWTIIKEVPLERVNSNSKLYKTDLYDAWSTSSKVPALLHKVKRVIEEPDGSINEIVVDPWYNAWKPYGKPSEIFNQELINDLADLYAQDIISKSKPQYPWEPRLFTFKEACEGIPGFVKGTPRNTSAGYPWSKISKKKYAFFGRESEYEYDSKEFEILRTKVNDDIDLLKQGIIPDWVYMQFIKDELRSKAKVDAGKSRIVMGAPVDKTSVSNMYFKDFYRWLQDNRIFNGIAIGINPNSSEWEAAMRYLQSVGDNIVDGDFAFWDGTQPWAFDIGFLRVCEAYYYNGTDEDRAIRERIIKSGNVSNHLVTIDNHSYIASVSDTMASGDTATGPKNTVNNNLRSLYARAHLLLKARGYSGHMDYRRDLENYSLKDVLKDRFLALGDDHLLSVCEEHLPFMNQRQYGETMIEFGFMYTDAQKSAHLLDGYRKLADCVFLKRIWVRHREDPTHVYAALELPVILEMPYWLERGSPPDTIFQVIDIVAKELSAHGLEVYSRWARVISLKSRELIGYQSIYLPNSSDPEEIRDAWKRASYAFRSTDLEYLA